MASLSRHSSWVPVVDIVGVHYTFDQWKTTNKALADWVGEHPYKRREEGPAIKRRPDDSQFIIEIPLGAEPLDPEDKVWFALYATRPANDSWYSLRQASFFCDSSRYKNLHFHLSNYEFGIFQDGTTFVFAHWVTLI